MPVQKINPMTVQRSMSKACSQAESVMAEVSESESVKVFVPLTIRLAEEAPMIWRRKIDH
tara:strand:+ start:27679 stop:27858 length:180 start_codon:yes stop_codon:yes gene_type:complete